MARNEQRAVANVRERKRTQKLNQAYKQLQAILPKEPSDKMSKIHTLKLALIYIDFLNDLLKEGDTSEGECSPAGTNVTDTYYQHPTVGLQVGSPQEMALRDMRTDPYQDERYNYEPSCKRFRPDPEVGTIIYDQMSNVRANHSDHLNIDNQTKSGNRYGMTYITRPTESVYTNCNTQQTHYSAFEHHQPKDDLTQSLRSAFREYRSIKRKRYD